MEHNKAQHKENVQATDLKNADAQCKEDHREQDNGTGYNRRKGPAVEHLKNSISRLKWEH